MKNKFSIERMSNVEVRDNVIPERGSIVERFRDKTVITEPLLHYPDLQKTVKGVVYYSDRSLILPSKRTIVARTDKTEHFAQPLMQYYTDNCIGARNYDVVDTSTNKSTLETVLATVKTKEELMGYAPLLLFAQSPESQEIFERIAENIYPELPKGKGVFKVKNILGLPILRSTDVSGGWKSDTEQFVGNVMNDDVMLRRFLLKKYPELTMPARIIMRENINKRSIDNFFAQNSAGYIKYSGSASGSGIKRVQSYNDVRDFILNHHNVPAFVLTADISQQCLMNMTVQFYIDHDGIAHGEGVTQQIVDRATGTTHQGNLISSDSLDAVNSIDNNQLGRLRCAIQELAGRARDTHIGVDVFRTDDGLKVIEINGRMTGAIHPIALMDQLRVLTNDRRPITVLSINTVQPQRIYNSFSELQSDFGEYLFSLKKFHSDGHGGIVPTLVQTLPEKMGAAIVGKNIDDVKEMAQVLCQVVGDDVLGRISL